MPVAFLLLLPALALVAAVFLWPLLRPVWPDVFSDYRLFLVSTMMIAAIAVDTANPDRLFVAAL